MQKSDRSSSTVCVNRYKMFKHIITLIWNKKKKNTLLFLEIFFSFMILFVVFGFVISNLRLYQTPLGFDTENQWIARLVIEEDADSMQVAEMKTNVLREISEMPNIESAAFGCRRMPFFQSMWNTGHDKNGFELQTCFLFGDEHFAEAMGLNVVEGRWFNEDDLNAKYTPVVVSKQLVDECFAGRKYLDSLFIFEDDNHELITKYCRVVGVMDHYKYFGEFEEEYNASFFYLPSTHKETSSLYMKIAENAPPDLEEKVNRRIAEVTKTSDFTIANVEKNRKQSSKDTWVPIIALLTICGFLVLNVALGLFGVLWYTISKRRPEIGLRRTLGASRFSISSMITGEVVLVSLFGILVGTIFAVQFPMLQFFDTETINYYYAMAASGGLILTLVFICALFPSRQAGLVNPAIALHED